jgi:hypothetical protein
MNGQGTKLQGDWINVWVDQHGRHCARKRGLASASAVITGNVNKLIKSFNHNGSTPSSSTLVKTLVHPFDSCASKAVHLFLAWCDNRTFFAGHPGLSDNNESDHRMERRGLPLPVTGCPNDVLVYARKNAFPCDAAR